MDKLKIKFDKLTSHDITFVGIIQTARASGLTKFPMPYVLTNCHNSLCAVGGTINEDDHVFGLSAAKKYGGIYVPPHQAVIHQFAREMLAGGGKMILGSDSHTRYGALGTMAMGEGGPELVKQLLNQTYDINMPGVVGIYLKGEPVKGVGPQDVALAIIGAVFKNGYVKNKVMEFVGPGVSALSADFSIGVDVMTTETTCLSSIWKTDDKIKEFYEIHERAGEYKELNPGEVAYYDGMVDVDLSAIRPMIAMPFHPATPTPSRNLMQILSDILDETEERAQVSLDGAVEYDLKSKVKNGKFVVDQGIIAGCAGGGFENICAAADILRGRYIGSDAFTLSVYPLPCLFTWNLSRTDALQLSLRQEACSRPHFADLASAQEIHRPTMHSPSDILQETSPTERDPSFKTARFHPLLLWTLAPSLLLRLTEEFLLPLRSLTANLQITSIIMMQISIRIVYLIPRARQTRMQSLFSVPISRTGLRWSALPENLILRVVSEIHDPVTTTDELIPSGETSSYRSNPLGLAEFALSRKDPLYVGRAKEIKAIEDARVENPEHLCKKADWVHDVMHSIKDNGFAEASPKNTGFGSTIFAVKPGDGSAREQAASCQKVLGGWANIANEYATKRYRSNLINWGMLPFLIPEGELPFKNLDFLFIPDIKKAVEEKQQTVI